MIRHIIKFFIDNKLVAWLLLLLFAGLGFATAPFDLESSWLPRDPVSVDAIPDIGENQQIIYTRWEGRSPQDIEDQITYPLTTALLGIPGVKTIRSNSMFGFSTVYLIFEEDIEFYWSRSRILEKLNSLPPNLLPEGIQPALGPDATALGQIYWYTLEGRDENGDPTGGWDLHELRSIQDFYVRYGLASASGVSEVASVGGFVQEYHIDLDPDKLRIYDISMEMLMKTIRESNLDVGAQTMEINLAEYFVRGLGYIKSLDDIKESVVTVRENVPIRIKDIARVSLGPAPRRGVLDKSGAEAVGGVVVARYGANPLEVINNVKEKIKEIEGGMPSKTLEDGSVSKVTIVPFYDRTDLIQETLGTLEEALGLEILITIIVVIIMLLNFRSSILIAGSLPLAVLMCFIAMRYFGVDANIVALSGIAIAIGTMVDMGIVLTESIDHHLKENSDGKSIKEVVFNATSEVASAVVTALATTIISFLPVFTMEAAEGKLFKPLAFTKTFALLAAIIVAIAFIPPIATQIFKIKNRSNWRTVLVNSLMVVSALLLFFFSDWSIPATILLSVGVIGLIFHFFGELPLWRGNKDVFKNILIALVVAGVLSRIWMPLGVKVGLILNTLFVVLLIVLVLAFFYLVYINYERILRFLLRVRYIFLLFIVALLIFGVQIFRNIGQEFMPALDEGSFLLMPTSMPHSGMEINVANLKALDMSVTAIPEVEVVLGKAGRVESALDPAPMSMYENVILYKSEYRTDEHGRKIRFKVDGDGKFIRDSKGVLIPDKRGQYFRQWRDHIKTPDDIWDEIVKATRLPGITSAPKLQPIQTRLIMLQTGMRSPMGIKVYGPDLKTIESFGLQLENEIKKVEGVKAPSVFAERIVGKPYLMLDINREVISRYGLTIELVQRQIQAAIGGMAMTTTVEGRERYKVRLRYPREFRSDPESLRKVLISTPTGIQIPLGDLVEIKYQQGPQSIKSENGFLVGYVLFDKEDGFAETDVVFTARDHLAELIANNDLIIPAGISYKFTGNYEQQVRANKRLAVVLPISLLLIFLILYFHFGSATTSIMVFSGVFVAFSGGFMMLWLYGEAWFLNFDLFGNNLRDIFNMGTVNLSIAVWVGFLALFGIATDDGVLVATFLKDSFKQNSPGSIQEIEDAVVQGGLRRVKPALMTTATTILALLPILTSSGRGADIMIPMAIPSFGGMVLQTVTMFTVPILYCIWKEQQLKNKLRQNKSLSYED
ncbi:MAG: efflux RND transporter permease subunit [Chitinophagales bacterium]|nr:efflux RND transporter permease subunit [Chitinophagales bacterium]